MSASVAKAAHAVNSRSLPVCYLKGRQTEIVITSKGGMHGSHGSCRRTWRQKRALDAIIRRLKPTHYEIPADGTWTVKDVLGHIAAYADAERRAVAVGLGRSRDEPRYFDEFLPWNDEQFQRRRTWRSQRIVSEVEETAARYLSLVKSLYEEDLSKQIRFPWNEQGTVHALIVSGLEHQREHRAQLAAVLEQPV